MTDPPRRLMRFPEAVPRDPAVDAWLDACPAPLGPLARRWYDALRACGDDVRECLHDRAPTACAGDLAFAYVAAFSEHVHVGFYNGPHLPDPAGLLEGRGKFMRHVKLRPGAAVDEAALAALVGASYREMKARG